MLNSYSTKGTELSTRFGCYEQQHPAVPNILRSIREPNI